MRPGPRLQHFDYGPEDRLVSAYSGSARHRAPAAFDRNAEIHDFSRKTSPAARQVLAVLAIFALFAAGLVSALYYFAGPVAAAAATLAMGLLVVWGNWIVSNVIEL